MAKVEYLGKQLRSRRLSPERLESLRAERTEARTSLAALTICANVPEASEGFARAKKVRKVYGFHFDALIVN